MLVFEQVSNRFASKIQIIKSNLVQVGGELEEALRVTGISWIYFFSPIIMPLVARAVIVSAILGFIHAARNVSTVALSSSSSRGAALAGDGGHL